MVEKILAWRGGPFKRTTMEFEVLFADGDIVWKVWDVDLSNTIHFEDFCRANRQLYLLLITVERTRIEIKDINRQPITEVKPGDVVFVDLRYFGTYIYDEILELPDKFHIQYVVRFEYTHWCGPKGRQLMIDAHVPLLTLTYQLNHLIKLKKNN